MKKILPPSPQKHSELTIKSNKLAIDGLNRDRFETENSIENQSITNKVLTSSGSSFWAPAEKKMPLLCLPTSTHTQTPTIIYRPAKLTKGKEWFISYYVFNPAKNKLDRVRVKVNRVKNIAERERWVKTTISQLNKRLEKGWSPFESIPENYSTNLKTAINRFLTIKEKEMRENGFRSYKSICGKINYYLDKSKNATISVNDFTQLHASDMMMYYYTQTKMNGRTYNNYIIVLRALWNWMIESGIANENVFSNIRRKKEQAKGRAVIPDDLKVKILSYLKIEMTGFYVMCLLAYYCLMRPKEIGSMKIKHFIPAKNAIFIPGENAKNGHERFSTIPDFMIQLLINHASISTDTENYMFSGKNFIPGKILTETRDVGRYWQKLRKILSLPNEIQFYSLRDSGIIQMLTEGVPPQEVKRQADHSSLEITDRYLRHAKPGENLNIKRMCEI